MRSNMAEETVVIEKRSITKPKISVGVIFDNIVWLLLVIAIVVMGSFDSIFFSATIFNNILVQASVLGVLTAGLCFSLLLGEIDLSVVGILGFAAGIGTILMNNGIPWPLAVVVIVLIGFLVGAINGFLVAKLKAVSLIQTLAMMITLQGALMAITKGRSIVNFPESFRWVGQGSILGIPALPIAFLLVYLLVYVIWKKTEFGRSLYAVGGNADSSHASGIRVDRIRIYAFMISGTFAGFSGYLLASYMGAVTVTFGSEYLLYSIAAAVIGGISLKGGRGNISGVLGGVLLLTVIQVGLQVLGISSYYVQMAGGLMILVAVVLDAVRLKLQG